MPVISPANVITLLLLLALQERRSQVTPPPIRIPVMASTAASHPGTLSVQLEVRGRVVLCVVGAVVVVEMGTLFSFVKM